MVEWVGEVRRYYRSIYFRTTKAKRALENRAKLDESGRIREVFAYIGDTRKGSQPNAKDVALLTIPNWTSTERGPSKARQIGGKWRESGGVHSRYKALKGLEPWCKGSVDITSFRSHKFGARSVEVWPNQTNLAGVERHKPIW